MSSAEEELNDEGNLTQESAQGLKKRRVQRACDVCRRKKIRCDGGAMPGHRCSNCISCNTECTYVEAAKKRGPSKGYVADLENRLRNMEMLLSKLAPRSDLIQELGEKNDQSQAKNTMSTVAPPAVPKPSPYVQFHNIITSNPEDNGIIPLKYGAEDDDDAILAENMDRLRLDPIHQRFIGKSSGIMLVRAAVSLRNEYTGQDDQCNYAATTKRPEYWNVCPWEIPDVKVNIPSYDFPEDDLMAELIVLYFENVNIFLPILHRPTFDKGIADGIHRSNSGFGETVLLVCALASRYSHDRRVHLPNVESDLSAGWKWFDQVRLTRRPVLEPPTLYDLQSHYLSALYLQGCSAPQRNWNMIGVGIRLAQDVGAHRRKMHKPTVENELWKRAFWALVFFDRFLSSCLGRPCATQDEDFDIDFPVECDDEYWEHPDPEKAFKQPPNKPSKASFFVVFLKLNQILAFALRTIYATDKAKTKLGFVGHQWDQQVVADLDSALNEWVDGVPEHLRWDPDREDKTFFLQSACLHAWYNHLQILVHRPFISLPRQPSPLSLPSLTICTNAARSCSHIIYIQHGKTGVIFPHMHLLLLTASIVLLVNIWGGKRSELSTNINTDMEDVQKCMIALKLSEHHYHVAGRFWDVLRDLSNVGEPLFPRFNQGRSYKRERDCDRPKAGSSATISSASSTRSAEQIQDPSELQGISTQRNLPPAPQVAGSSQSSLFPLQSDEPNKIPVHGEVELMRYSNERIDRTNQSWSLTFEGSKIPQTMNSSQGYNELDATSSTMLPDYMFQGQLGNGSMSSFGQQLDSSQGQTYGLYPGDVDTTQQFQHQYSQAMIDSNAIEIWDHAPTGFELNDWDSYMTELGLGQPHAVYEQAP